MTTNKYDIRTEVIVRVIIAKENKVLLCRGVSCEYYFLPGGHVEFGDTLEETLYKEMKEELGLERSQISHVTFVNYLENSYVDTKGTQRHELNMIFNATVDKDLTLVSFEDHIEFSWHSLDELNKITVYPKDILNSITAGVQN